MKKIILLIISLFFISSTNVFAENPKEYWDKKYWEWKYIMVTVQEPVPWMDCKKSEKYNDLYNCFQIKKTIKKNNNLRILFLYILPENVQILLKIIAPWFYKI